MPSVMENDRNGMTDFDVQPMYGSGDVDEGTNLPGTYQRMTEDDVANLGSSGMISYPFNLTAEDISSRAPVDGFEKDRKSWVSPLRTEDGSLAEFDRNKDDMEPLADTPGIFKKLLKRGDDVKIDEDFLVVCRYEIFQPGFPGPVDSSMIHGRPLQFRVGRGIVIRGMDACVRSMHCSEHSKFYVEAKLGFQPYASTDGPMNTRINKDQPLLLCIYVDEVVANPCARKLAEMTAAQIEEAEFDVVYQSALEEKNVGNDYMKRGAASKAQIRYRWGIQRLSFRKELEADDEKEQKKKDLLAILCCNISMALMRTHAPQKALTRAEEAIKYAEGITEEEQRRLRMSKALYLAGKAANKSKQYELAVEYLNRAFAMDKKNEDIGFALRKNQRDFGAWKKDQKGIERRMIGAFLDEEKKEDKTVRKGMTKEEADLVSPELREYITTLLTDFAMNRNEVEWEIPTMFTPFEVTYIGMIAERLGLDVTERKGKSFARKPFNYTFPTAEEMDETIAAQQRETLQLEK